MIEVIRGARKFVLFLPLVLLSLSLMAQTPATRPRITGIGSVTINVKNRDAAIDFYSKKLGLIAGVVCDGGPSGCLGIGPAQRLGIVSAPSPTEGQYLGEIAFVTDDADSLRDYLNDRHVKTSAIVKSGDYNRILHFTALDPEGHTVGFLQLGGCLVCIDHLTEPDPRVSSRLIHAGFVVRDRATTDHFYKDILGFRPYWHGGMKDDKDDWVAMQVPDGTDWLEYMLNISPTADHHTLGVMNHIALGVNDIHATEKQLIANGWKPTEEPKLGRDGKWQLNLYDPDDTRTEFMEFRPKDAPCCSAFTGPHPGPK